MLHCNCMYLEGFKMFPSQALASFTIVITNYNYAQFLGQAIQSALDQTWPEVRVVVVDDGSTDGSLAVAARYAAPNYRVVAKANGGQNSAVAAVLAEIGTDYVIALDSDDRLSPGACAAVAAAIGARRPNAVMWKLERRDGDDRPRGLLPAEPFLGADAPAHIAAHGGIPSPPTSGNAYRTAFLRELFAVLDDGSFSFDGYASWAAAWTGDVVCLDAVLGLYRVHGGNVSGLPPGADRRRRARVIGFALAHYHHLHAWLATRGEAPASWRDLVDAYTWRDVIACKGGAVFGEFGWAFLFAEAVRKFARAAHLGPWRQVKNIAFVALACTVLPLRDLSWRP